MYAATIQPSKAEALKLKFAALKEQELNQVSGGEEDGAIIEAIVVAGLLAAVKIIISTIMPDTFEELYAWVKSHKAAVYVIISGTLSPLGLAAYMAFSESKQKKFWKKVYEMAK